MLKIVEDQCEFTADNGVVIMASDESDSNKSFPELDGIAARNEALRYAAQQGLADPRMNGGVDKFPVDAEGNEVGPMSTTPVDHYAARYPVVRKLV